MKAAVINSFGEPGIFEISEVPEPVPGDHDILIETWAGSINPIDWKQRKGNHKFLFGAPFPIVLGYDVSGVVKKTGTKVSDFKDGDYVCGVLNNKYGGGLCQFARGSEKCFARVNAPVDLAASAALPLTGLTALQALRDKGRIASGMKVLIIGAAGGVGHYAVQIAKIYESEVYAVSSERHKEFVDSLAKNTFIDYQKEDILKLKERFHIVFDTVGSLTFPKCKHILLPGGVYINTLPRPKILWHKILSVFTNGKKVKTLLMRHNQHDLNLLLSWVQTNQLKICIDKVFGIHEIAEAHAYSEAEHTQGKILIRYNW